MERCNCNTGRRGPHLLVIEVSLNLLGVLAGLPHHGTSGTPDGGGGTTNPADALSRGLDEDRLSLGELSELSLLGNLVSLLGNVLVGGGHAGDGGSGDGGPDGGGGRGVQLGLSRGLEGNAAHSAQSHGRGDGADDLGGSPLGRHCYCKSETCNVVVGCDGEKQRRARRSNTAQYKTAAQRRKTGRCACGVRSGTV